MVVFLRLLTKSLTGKEHERCDSVLRPRERSLFSWFWGSCFFLGGGSRIFAFAFGFSDFFFAFGSFEFSGVFFDDCFVQSATESRSIEKISLSCHVRIGLDDP